MPRARHDVIAEAAGDHLATLLVVNDVLAKHLAQTLHHRAVHLPFDDGVADDMAAVIHRQIRNDIGNAGVRIDFHLGDVATVGVGRGERAFAHHRQLFLRRHLAQRDFLLAVRRREFTLAVIHLRGFDTEVFRRQ